MRMITCSQDLIKYLTENQQPIQAKIIAKTVVKLNKKDVETKTEHHTFDSDIFKIQQYNVELNKNYGELVNEKREEENKESDFKSEKRKMGGVNVNRAIIDKEGQLYLTSILISTGQKKYEYLNKEIEKSTFERFVPIKKTYSGNQGLDNQVIVNTFKLENIVELEIEGVMKYIK